MKLPLDPRVSGLDVLRRSGYGLIYDRHRDQESFVRHLGRGSYPRFHCYVESGTINLHLDQKAASYAGTSAHAGEYDGPAVEAEGQRILAMMQRLAAPPADPTPPASPAGGWRTWLGL